MLIIFQLINLQKFDIIKDSTRITRIARIMFEMHAQHLKDSCRVTLKFSAVGKLDITKDKHPA
jgi:hypothetical protein